jgi:predicted SnoaL-like aldol condensation-catalyzing enzyme
LKTEAFFAHYDGGMKRSLILSGALLLCALYSTATPYAQASPSDNRETANRLVQRFIADFNAMSTASFDEIFTEDYIEHSPATPSGRAGAKQFFESQYQQARVAHIRPHATIEDVLVDGDRVMLRIHITFTRNAKHYALEALDEWRISNGRFAEHWDTDQGPHPAP